MHIIKVLIKTKMQGAEQPITRSNNAATTHKLVDERQHDIHHPERGSGEPTSKIHGT
jgi:hypothetical protein